MAPTDDVFTIPMSDGMYAGALPMTRRNDALVVVINWCHGFFLSVQLGWMLGDVTACSPVDTAGIAGTSR